MNPGKRKFLEMKAINCSMMLTFTRRVLSIDYRECLARTAFVHGIIVRLRKHKSSTSAWVSSEDMGCKVEECGGGEKEIATNAARKIKHVISFYLMVDVIPPTQCMNVNT